MSHARSRSHRGPGPLAGEPVSSPGDEGGPGVDLAALDRIITRLEEP